jgi:hypothetical protein
MGSAYQPSSHCEYVQSLGLKMIGYMLGKWVFAVTILRRPALNLCNHSVPLYLIMRTVDASELEVTRILFLHFGVLGMVPLVVTLGELFADYA